MSADSLSAAVGLEAGAHAALGRAEAWQDALTRVDWAPTLGLLLLAALLALLPLGWLAWRQRGGGPARRLAALTALTLALTLDLIVLGAFTRLSDAGLGCPDWPGCYGQFSPHHAQAEIAQAEAAQPTGPVTQRKAWIEMLHRYLAMTVGALILTLALLSWRWRRQLPHGPALPLACLGWVLVQGAFGKFTVTLKLAPAVVTLHLLGALVLLALLVVQHERYRAAARPPGVGKDARPASEPPPLPRGAWPSPRPAAGAGAGLRRLWAAALLALGVQVALGGWVSSNYAVLACQGFPTCNGQWWPQGLDAQVFAQGFAPLRGLGQAAQAHGGGWLPVEALVAIHLSHRGMALVLSGLLLALVLRLWRDPLGAGHARWLLGLWLMQAGSGLGNVIWSWPLGLALLHSAGAAALVGVLVSLGCRLRWVAGRVPPVSASRPLAAAALATGANRP